MISRMESIKDISGRMRRARMTRGITLDELEKKTGLSRITLHKYEKAMVKNIAFDVRCRIAEAMNISPLCFCSPEEVRAAVKVAKHYAEKVNNRAQKAKEDLGCDGNI